MSGVLAAIGNLLFGVGGGLEVNTSTMVLAGYGDKSALLAGIGALLDPVFATSGGIGDVLQALGTWLASGTGFIASILGLL